MCVCVCVLHIPAPVCWCVCVYWKGGGDIIGSVRLSGCSLRLKPLAGEKTGPWTDQGLQGFTRGGLEGQKLVPAVKSKLKELPDKHCHVFSRSSQVQLRDVRCFSVLK